ncbi:MAG TPA: hypothetical protein VEU08_10105 [Vicinamibacterales bacterium]|nr:hypothetical protein [Vicinamibacterales bacterium]
MRKTIVVCAWLALVCAARAGAQDRVDDRSGLKMPMTIWAAGVAADQISTYRFATGYRDVLREANPLISGLDRHPVLLVAAGSAMDAATGWAAWRFFGTSHPRVAKALFYGAAAYRTYLAVHNVRLMQAMPPR